MKSGNIYIGTSNIVVPGNKNSYPMEFKSGSRLHYYSSFFNSLEINSSFYKTPMPATFKKWEADVPAGFRFSVKMSKAITHSKELKYDPAFLKQFLTAANVVDSKRGCLLVQFPGKIGISFYKEVAALLETIRKYSSNNFWRIAVEFRNPDWYIAETHELLSEVNGTLVFHDMPKSAFLLPDNNPSFIYQRFHGPAGDYRGDYEQKLLQDYAKRFKHALNTGKDVFVYFNNTMGNAFKNALLLSEMMRTR